MSYIFYLISNRQFDAIATVTSELYNFVDLAEPVLAVFLDLSKAFDTVNVNHSKLFGGLGRVRGLPFQFSRTI